MERYDLIPKATASALLNLSENGSYIPLAWIVLSHGDAIMSLIFRLLEDYRKRGSEGDFSVITLDKLKNHFDWEGQEYLIPYVHRIAVRVHQEIINAEEWSMELQERIQ